MDRDQATVYADITKVEKDPENPAFRLVHARISDETKDLDGQRADYDWLKTALPDWFKWGNVRDMHENNAVGKAKDLTDLGPTIRGFDGILKVVDPVAVTKVDEEVFTGVSIGIKGPRVFSEKGAQVSMMSPGWIKGGKIVEVSLVDHPCNENCKLTVLKVAKGGGLDLVKKVKLETDLDKARLRQKERDALPSSAFAGPGRSFPIHDRSHARAALSMAHYAKNPGAIRAAVHSKYPDLGAPKGKKNKIVSLDTDLMVEPGELDAYKSRFDPAFASQGLSLADGSYVITNPADLFLAKGLVLTGFGNVQAANLLIKRRESELYKDANMPNTGGCGCCDVCDADCDGSCCANCTMGKNKAAGATQQATPTAAAKPTAPGARSDRDSGNPNAPKTPAANPAAKAPDKSTPAHQSPDASGSQAAYADSHPTGSPPTKAKKKKGKNNRTVALDPMTHGDDTGAQGTQTNTAKAAEVWNKFAGKGEDPSQFSDKRLLKVAKAAQVLQKALPPGTSTTGARAGNSDIANSGPSSFGFDSQDRSVQDFQRGGAGSPGGGRALLEQLIRNMQGRMIDYSQGPQAVDIGRGGSGGPDAPQEAGETGPDELLNQSGLMRDGDPRIGANTPTSALGQSGPMDGGNSVVSPKSGNDPGVPNTSLPFASAPQAGADQHRVAPGQLPGVVGAPGDATPRIQEGGTPGRGLGATGLAGNARSQSPAGQAGTDANAGHRTSPASPNTSFPWPDRQPSPGGTGSGTGAAVAGVATRMTGGIAGTQSAITNTAGAKAAKPDKKKGKKAKKAAKAAKKINKLAGASTPKAAQPDTVKAAVASALKKFAKSLEREILVKYATVDELGAIRADVEELGKRAKPGSEHPFVGKIVASEKDFAANEFAQPGGEVPPQVLDRMERYARMAQDPNHMLAVSAQAELTKMLKVYFPDQPQDEIAAVVKKRSTAKQR